MDLTVQWARVLVSWYCCYDIVHMVDVNIFEYFNMPESCWGSAIQQWQSDMKLHHLLSLHFHKALFTTLTLIEYMIAACGFLSSKAIVTAITTFLFFVCVFRFLCRYAEFEHRHALSSRSTRLIRKTCIAILKRHSTANS